ncbi:AP2/ERF domain-containing protein [Artemisia annua]|uniref:AP2/ERF domain-containing protein n=1 Tax=Artemisia annua TaxID=35608 RepID=A0A2U1KXA7_ARTAN|nr:AP2/ERF domain-containing protein [Artemisia annua]
MDVWNNVGFQQFPTAGGELMEALLPFIETCKYSPLHSSITAKLDEICQSLADGKSIDGRKKSCKSTIKSKMPAEEGKVEGSESDVCSGSSNSSQSSGLMFPELALEESVWYDYENFSLEKCPPYEIDWGSI